MADSDPQNVRVNFRFSKEHYELNYPQRLLAEAAKLGLTLSEYARKKLIESLEDDQHGYPQTFPWNIAKDASTSPQAHQIAELLFPPGDHPFFGSAAQVVAAGVMDCLNQKAKDRWTLTDLCSALLPENIQHILTTTPRGEQIYKTYFADQQVSSQDLLKTLMNKTDLLLRTQSDLSSQDMLAEAEKLGITVSDYARQKFLESLENGQPD